MARKATSIELAFGKALREFRAQAELSQEALGLQSDLHPTYISQLERGLKSPSLTTIRALAEMRHSTPTLTSNIYTRLQLHDGHAAVARIDIGPAKKRRRQAR